MATKISFAEWAVGQDIALEFRVLGIEDQLVAVQPVLRAGLLDVWTGQVENLVPMSAVTLSGFVIKDGDLVLKHIDVIL